MKKARVPELAWIVVSSLLGLVVLVVEPFPPLVSWTDSSSWARGIEWIGLVLVALLLLSAIGLVDMRVSIGSVEAERPSSQKNEEFLHSRESDEEVPPSRAVLRFLTLCASAGAVAASAGFAASGQGTWAYGAYGLGLGGAIVCLSLVAWIGQRHREALVAARAEAHLLAILAESASSEVVADVALRHNVPRHLVVLEEARDIRHYEMLATAVGLSQPGAGQIGLISLEGEVRSSPPNDPDLERGPATGPTAS